MFGIKKRFGIRFETIDGAMGINPDETDEDTLFKLATDAMYLRNYYKRNNDVMLEFVFDELMND